MVWHHEKPYHILHSSIIWGHHLLVNSFLGYTGTPKMMLTIIDWGILNGIVLVELLISFVSSLNTFVFLL